MVDLKRPDPDVLLSSIQGDLTDSKGKLKVFIGMSAGVGKTYAMLLDAKEDLQRGVDVVCGYIEPHGRIETESLASEFEKIPPLEISHNNLLLKELNLEAVISRHPKIVLIDELAHTNPPDMKNTKRWEDVLELIEYGIDVYTTVNIQHLESLNDVIYSITGVRVQETVPDILINNAYQVELIDIPPEELIERLREGKIYAPEKVEVALKGFFTETNLSALRELVLRKVADRVDADVLRLRSQQPGVDVWGVRERILVAVGSNRFAIRLIRAAKRIAESRKAELVIVSVSTPKSIYGSTESQKMLEHALVVGERLGARIVRRHGIDLVGEIIGAAQECNASLIVVGKSLRSRFFELIFGSVVDDLIRRSGKIAIHLITGQAEQGYKIRLPKYKKINSVHLAYNFIAISLTTAFCFLLTPYFAPTNLSIFYLLTVVLTATYYGRLQGVISALVGVAAFNFFFVPPTFTFIVNDFQYLILFAMMILVALLLGGLTSQMREHVREISERERRTRLLFLCGKELVACRSNREVAETLALTCKEIISSEVWVSLWQENSVSVEIKTANNTIFESESPVMKLAGAQQNKTGKGTDILPGSKGTYFPIRFDEKFFGVLGIIVNSEISQADETNILLLLQLTSLACQRLKLEAESYDASINIERERTRNILLSAVSHDLRTPLTAIKGCASTLLETESLSLFERSDLLKIIRQESERLEYLVRNVLDLVRLETPEFKLNLGWVDLSEIASSAVDEIESRIDKKLIQIVIKKDLRPVKCDHILIKQLFINILENACKHAKNSKIEIILDSVPGFQVVTFRDFGKGIPTGQETEIFKKSSRLDSSSEVKGFGLGLSICQEIVKLHHGTIVARNATGGGAEFEVRIPEIIE